MKSSQHVHSYLSSVRGNGEIDELAIIQYCVGFGIKAEFSNTEKEPRKITFEQFKDWFSYDLPQKNDVIVLNDTGIIGIVERVDYNSIVTGVSLSPTGKLSTTSVETIEPRGETFRYATEDEMVRLQKTLYGAKLAWNKKFGKLGDRFIPTENSLVRISLLTKRLGIGVFKEIDADGNVIMYCIKMEDEPLRYSLCENIGKVTGYQIDMINNAERRILKNEFAKVGKVWNGHEKRVEPIDFRVAPGKTYYYIDNYLEIVSTNDYRKPKDLRRFWCGNYYTCREEAEEILQQTISTRKAQLLRPGTEAGVAAPSPKSRKRRNSIV